MPVSLSIRGQVADSLTIRAELTDGQRAGNSRSFLRSGDVDLEVTASGHAQARMLQAINMGKVDIRAMRAEIKTSVSEVIDSAATDGRAVLVEHGVEQLYVIIAEAHAGSQALEWLVVNFSCGHLHTARAAVVCRRSRR